MARRIVVVGASAGGVEALVAIARALPADLAAPVAVVLHTPAAGPSALPAILARAGPLDARHARHGESLEAGTIYVAPPDHHLLVRDGAAQLARGAQENGHRPAIDPLFRSAARQFGAGAVAVILSGSRDDGAAGVAAVAEQGGHVIVQDPADALIDSMPENAIAANHPEFVVPVNEIAAVIARLAAGPVPDRPADHTKEADVEERYAELDLDVIGDESPPGRPSSLSCPDCGGVLRLVEDGHLLRFPCRVGHAYGAESLLGAQSDTIEEALWTALRALEERIDLHRRVSRRLRERGDGRRAENYERQALESEPHVKVLREVLLDRGGP
jgi:two-component system chemotaxis response regulator CheB